MGRNLQAQLRNSMITRTTNGTITSGVQSTPSASSSVSAGDFSQQLSKALSESLQKLGKTPGEIKINVRNGDNPATRQFVITLTDDAATPATAATSTSAPK